MNLLHSFVLSPIVSLSTLQHVLYTHNLTIQYIFKILFITFCQIHIHYYIITDSHHILHNIYYILFIILIYYHLGGRPCGIIAKMLIVTSYIIYIFQTVVLIFVTMFITMFRPLYVPAFFFFISLTRVDCSSSTSHV